MPFEEIKLDELWNELKEIKKEISLKRKMGFEVSIPEMLTMNIGAKIRYAEVNQQEKDKEVVKDKFSQIRKELKECKVDKEYAAYKTNKLINDCEKFCDDEMYDDCLKVYKEIKEYYAYLEEKVKKEIYPRLSTVAEKLENRGKLKKEA